jgi:hypothetical protein
MITKINNTSLTPEIFYSDIITRVPMFPCKPEQIRKLPKHKRNLTINMFSVYDALVKNPIAFNKLLSDKKSTLLMFLWLDLAECTKSHDQEIRGIPYKIWHSLMSHNFYKDYESNKLGDTAQQLFGTMINFAGDIMFTNPKTSEKFCENIVDKFHHKNLVLHNQVFAANKRTK